MDVVSTMDVQSAPTYAATGAVSSDELWTEADWLVWLPPYVVQWVATTRLLGGFAEYRTRVRFIEAVLFAAVVLYVVAQTAIAGLLRK
jgi:hypothetical protein